MSSNSLSPQRNRKAQQGPSGVPGPVQAVRRELSPSPTQRTRYHRAHSMPVMPQIMQGQQSQTLPPNSTLKDMTQLGLESQSLPPASHPMGAFSAGPNSVPHLGYPRPIARIPPPNFLHDENGSWQMTEELMAQMGREGELLMHQSTGPAAPGTEGVCFPGGAVTGVSTMPPSLNRYLSNSPPKAVEKLRERVSPREDSVGANVVRKPPPTQSQPSIRDSPQSRPQAHRTGSRPMTPEVPRGSPYAGAATPPALRKVSLNSPTVKTRTPDRSLPVQEEAEPEEENGRDTVVHEHSPDGWQDKRHSPAPSSDLNPMNDLLGAAPQRRVQRDVDEDEEGTLVDTDAGSHFDQRPSQQQQYQHQPQQYVQQSQQYPQQQSQFQRTPPHPAQHVPLPVHQQTQPLPQQQAGPRLSDEDEDDGEGSGAYTPRSPQSSLLETPQYGMMSLHQALNAITENGVNQSQQSQPRPGSNESQRPVQQVFNPAVVEQAVRKLQNGNGSVNNGTIPQLSKDRRVPSQQVPQQYQQQQQQQYQQPQQQQTTQRQSHAMPMHRQPSEEKPPRYGQYDVTDISQLHPDDLESMLDEAAYFQAYMQSSRDYSRPNAPIPPSNHSQTAAPSPFPGSEQGSLSNNSRPLPVGSPYPYPFQHFRRYTTFPSDAHRLQQSQSEAQPAANNYDPATVQEQLALQMYTYALNNGGLMSDSTYSTFSPASTPYPGANVYNSMSAFLSQSRFRANRHDGQVDGHTGDRDLASVSLRSSPSHLPMELPPPPVAPRGRGLKKRSRFSTVNIRGGGTIRKKVIDAPPRVESTQPRETSPEPSSGEETTAATEKIGLEILTHSPSQDWTATGPSDDDEGGEWVDDDVDGEEDDLLDLEFHTTFVTNVDKRRKRFDQRWNDLVRAFQALDRQTDSTLLLLASPSHVNTLHALSSRSIRRDPSLLHSPAMSSMKSSFSQLASQRRAARSKAMSLIDRLSLFSSSSSGDGSPTSTGSREEELRRALGAALGSLSALGKIYEDREARWREEMGRLVEEREGVEVLLGQALGGPISEPRHPGH